MSAVREPDDDVAVTRGFLKRVLALASPAIAAAIRRSVVLIKPRVDTLETRTSALEVKIGSMALLLTNMNGPDGKKKLAELEDSLARVADMAMRLKAIEERRPDEV